VQASGYDDHEIERILVEWQITVRSDEVLQKSFGVRKVREAAKRYLS
jgi:hypothetical protein